MRLRYLSLRDAPPLEKLAIPFWQETVMGRACAIRFIVGVNGSGKSRLLQALAQIFLTIERFPTATLPFYVTLAYDLGTKENKRTVFLQYQPTENTTAELELIAYDWLSDEQTYDWENLSQNITKQQEQRRYDGSSGGVDYFLPKALIAYTSGATQSWRSIFSPALPLIDIPQLGEDEERPIGWAVEKEQQFLKEQGLNEEATDLKSVEIEQVGVDITQNTGYFIDTQQLKSVVCAVTLLQAQTDFAAMTNSAAENILIKQWDEDARGEQAKSGFRHLLNEVGWYYPVTIGFHINFQPDNWTLAEEEQAVIQQLFERASRIIRMPEPSEERLLMFDLRDKAGQTTVIEQLIEVFQEEEKGEVTPLDIFSKLYRWQRLGILTNIVIAIKKRGVKDLILYDWLSDGERLFIGRMALFHLMEGESDILALLDEPETHFNDVWKRRIVDVIDDSLQDMDNEIVITTHSSIALTDVFRIEVTRLELPINKGQVHYKTNRVNTFGASPTIIMREIFGAPESVGQRATEFLDLILMLAAHREEIHTIWNNEQKKEEQLSSLALSKLVEYVKNAQQTNELPHDYGDDEALKAYLYKILISVKHHVQKVRDREQRNRRVTVVEALQTLKDYIGEGFYQFEFRRRLRALEKLDNEN